MAAQSVVAYVRFSTALVVSFVRLEGILKLFSVNSYGFRVKRVFQLLLKAVHFCFIRDIVLGKTLTPRL